MLELQRLQLDHHYYNLTVHPPSKHLFTHYWHDLASVHSSDDHDKEFVDRFSEDSPPKKNRPALFEPEELKDSYRRAVNVHINFSLPFYGVQTRNITIATGGFCYIGENTHSWLAATQYIAPLMANFQTNGPAATILYEELGEFKAHNVLTEQRIDSLCNGKM